MVSGFAAQCCGPAWGGRKTMWTAGDGPAADGSWAAHARERKHSNTGGTACAERCFFFFSGKDQKTPFYLLDGDSSRRSAVLGHRHRRGNAARCGKTQLVEDRGLWPPFQLIQLIYLCRSVKREKRMDVCFLLTLYI